jgi:FtsH-binding integral membrane protein
MNLWLRTYVWTLFHEMLAVALSVLVGIGALLSAQAMIAQQPWVVLVLGLLACVIALSMWWRFAGQFVVEPDPALNDPRPFTARLAADMTTTLFGVGIVALCVVQITALDEPQTRWGLLATILGGPFVALGLGSAWERWNTRTFGD